MHQKSQVRVLVPRVFGWETVHRYYADSHRRNPLLLSDENLWNVSYSGAKKNTLVFSLTTMHFWIYSVGLSQPTEKHVILQLKLKEDVVLKTLKDSVSIQETCQICHWISFRSIVQQSSVPFLIFGCTFLVSHSKGMHCFLDVIRWYF